MPSLCVINPGEWCCPGGTNCPGARDSLAFLAEEYRLHAQSDHNKIEINAAVTTRLLCPERSGRMSRPPAVGQAYCRPLPGDFSLRGVFGLNLALRPAEPLFYMEYLNGEK